jgi:hypothetical protein
MEKGFSWSNIAVGEFYYCPKAVRRYCRGDQVASSLSVWGKLTPIIGATMNMFEVTTLGQPLEVLKTQMAANRSQTMGQAFRNVWARGGVSGFYQGLIPWVSFLLCLRGPS